MDWEKEEPNGEDMEITHAQVSITMERRRRVGALRWPSTVKEEGLRGCCP